MNITNILGQEIQVTDLNEAIAEANRNLGLAWDLRNDKKNPQIPCIEISGKEVNAIQYHSHMLNALLELLPPLQFPNWLFVGGRSACFSYSDMRKKEHGDYKSILLLFYSPLRIEISAANMKKYADILEIAKEHLRRLQIRVHQPLIVSGSGQTTGLSLSSGPDVIIK